MGKVWKIAMNAEAQVLSSLKVGLALPSLETAVSN
ncbi:hypothetical protein HYPP_01380 [Hyphomicrobium sp. ghe19]|nr:hypothetical protein HYPP_01380 [Hyphomicrobium sp. ghe19]